jgi:hypothetical protein
LGDETKKNEMARTYDTYKEKGIAYRILVEEPRKETTLNT